MSTKNILTLLLGSCSLLSCGKKAADLPTPPSKGSYFSIRQFAKDQFDTYWGQPFMLQKIVVLNDKKDTVTVNALTMDWASVLKTFLDADISDPKFVGQYDFSMFNDDATVSTTYYYEAKDPSLFTRKLQIITDQFTDKIKSIYIETELSGRLGKKAQKLYYSPVKVIQIQEFESSVMAKDRNLRVEYRF